MISAKKHKTRHDLGRKVIHWELCKKFKFVYMKKWDMYNPEFTLENETYKVFWDFDIPTDHQIPARQPNPVIVNKKKRTC